MFAWWSPTETPVCPTGLKRPITGKAPCAGAGTASIRARRLSNPLIRIGNEIGLVTPFAGDIDRIRVYMPFDEAQTYFNRDGVADEIEVMLADPENSSYPTTGPSSSRR